MRDNDIQFNLERIARCVQDRQTSEAGRLARTVFIDLLKWGYAQVRSQAPSSVMRGLLDLEIEIGGDDSDFNAFGGEHMLDLFIRGAVSRHLSGRLTSLQWLFQTTDIEALWHWMAAVADNEPSSGMDTINYFHAWLMLFAGAAGLVVTGNPTHDAEKNRTGMPSAKASNRLVKGDPYSDPVTGMTFVFVAGGTFSMGDTFDEGVDDEKPVHAVILSDFYMATGPVTQAQWRCLMAENPSSFIGDDHPVEQVALADVVAFIEKLNASAPSGFRFDLPSEAQWEYAARSGGKDELYAGGSDAEDVAWFEADNLGRSAPVATKSANGLGLYDMSGNVWEWCRDVYQPDAYRHHGNIDPVWTKGGSDRVIRGGGWHLDAWSVRCARRFCFDPELFGPALGFRVVMVPIFPAAQSPGR